MQSAFPFLFHRHCTCIMVQDLFPLPFLHPSRFSPETSYISNPIFVSFSQGTQSNIQTYAKGGERLW